VSTNDIQTLSFQFQIRFADPTAIMNIDQRTLVRVGVAVTATAFATGAYMLSLRRRRGPKLDVDPRNQSVEISVSRLIGLVIKCFNL
jgi:hypothetical protein